MLSIYKHINSIVPLKPQNFYGRKNLVPWTKEHTALVQKDKETSF